MPRPSAETKKQQLIGELTDARSQVIEMAKVLPVALQDVPFLGVWSAHDIVAHLIGWDAANLDAIAAIQAGRLPSFYSAYDPDWRTYNSCLIAQYKQPSMAETSASAAASHRRLLDSLEALPASDFVQDYAVRSPRGRRVTIAMLLQAEASDERKHAEQIRVFARQGQEGERNELT